MEEQERLEKARELDHKRKRQAARDLKRYEIEQSKMTLGRYGFTNFQTCSLKLQELLGIGVRHANNLLRTAQKEIMRSGEKDREYWIARTINDLEAILTDPKAGCRERMVALNARVRLLGLEKPAIPYQAEETRPLFDPDEQRKILDSDSEDVHPLGDG